MNRASTEISGSLWPQPVPALSLLILLLLLPATIVLVAAPDDGQTPTSPSVAARLGIEQLAAAGRWLNSGDLAAAQQAYASLAISGQALAHHRTEASERLEEVRRMQAGLPVRDPVASRLSLAPLPRSAVTFHVSPGGADANPGSLEKPFATLERARDAIRAFKRQSFAPAGTLEIIVHDGQFPVRQTFTLEAINSGTELSPIVYRAAEGETPRFSGGVRLAGFKPVLDAAILDRLPRESAAKVREIGLRSCGVTNLMPLVLGGFASGRGFRTHPAHELFFNGRPMQLARGPNRGFLHVAGVAVKDGAKGYDREGSRTGKFFYEGDAPRRWLAEPDLLLYGYWFWDWADSYERVATIDPDQRLITLVEPWHTYGYSVGAPFYAVNALSELDEPGEYYLDRRQLKLFFYPPSDPGSATIELSVFPEPMVKLDHVSRVRFERLTWELG